MFVSVGKFTSPNYIIVLSAYLSHHTALHWGRAVSVRLHRSRYGLIWTKYGQGAEENFAYQIWIFGKLKIPITHFTFASDQNKKIYFSPKTVQIDFAHQISRFQDALGLHRTTAKHWGWVTGPQNFVTERDKILLGAIQHMWRQIPQWCSKTSLGALYFRLVPIYAYLFLGMVAITVIGQG